MGLRYTDPLKQFFRQKGHLRWPKVYTLLEKINETWYLLGYFEGLTNLLPSVFHKILE